jgi:hypothetical protein
MRLSSLLIICLSLFAVTLPAVTIHSTTAGGNWSDPNTWVEHVVPDSTTDLVVTSNVTIYAYYRCLSLLIEQTGVLSNYESSYYGTWGDFGITVNGNLDIQGTLRCLNEYPHYNSYGSHYNTFSVDLKGNITLEGVCTASTLRFCGTGDQTISQTDSVAYNCPVTIAKTTGQVVLGSRCAFSGKTLTLSTTPININGFIIENAALSNGLIHGGGVSSIKDCTLSTVTVDNDVRLDGSVVLLNASIIFNDNVQVVGTFSNYESSYYGTWGDFGITVNGNLDIQGTLRCLNEYPHYNSYGSRYNTFSVVLSSNLYNTGCFTPSSLQLTGSGSITVQNAAGVSGSASISSPSFIFVGDNVMPGFTIPGTSHVTVAPEAVLTLPNAGSSINGTIDNRGRISYNRNITNTSVQSYYMASATPNTDFNTRVDALVVETNGYSVPDYFQEGVQIWWNLVPTPTANNLTLAQLVLQYYPDMLNGYNESGLELVHSYDGVSWAKVGSVTLDTTNHRATVTNAPGSGYFAFTHTVQVAGRVVGYDNPSVGLANATISVLGEVYPITQTNATGNFTLRAPMYQECTLTASKTGYSPVSSTFQVWTTDINLGDLTLPEPMAVPTGFTAAQPALGNQTTLTWATGSRSFLNYSIYRLRSGDENTPTAWTLLTQQSETGYTDTAWYGIPFGVYRYALVGNYTGGATSPVFTDEVQRRDFSVTETFDTGALPTGWTTQHSGTTTAPWTPTLEQGTDYCMKVQNTATANEKLVTMTYDCTRYTRVSVAFNHRYLPNTNSQGVFQASVNGITWNTLATFTAVADSGAKSYDITSLAATRSSAKFRWSYTATSTAANSWSVDDFVISGYTPIPVYLADPYPLNPQVNTLHPTIGIKVIDDDQVDAASLQYRIDANGDGVYGAGEDWMSITGYAPAQNLVVRVQPTFSVQGDHLRYEFRAQDTAANGLSYSGSTHANGVADDYYVSIDTTLPSAIENLVATSISTTTATIHWSPISETNFQRYELYVSKDTTVNEFDVSLMPSDHSELGVMTSSSLTLSNLELNTYYWLSMRVVDTYGNKSAFCTPVLLTPISIPPVISGPAPTGQPTPAWATTRSVVIGCTVSDYYGVDTSNLQYRFDRNGNGVYDADENWITVPAEDIGSRVMTRNEGARRQDSRHRASVTVNVPVVFTSDGNTLHYEFRATDVNGFTSSSGTQNQAGIGDDWLLRIDTLIPAPVPVLHYNCVADSAVELSWSLSADLNFDRYEVYYGTHAEITLDDDCWSVASDSLLSLASTNMTHVTGLIPHRLYRFRIRAVDEAGNVSVLSNEVQAFYGELLPLASPTALRISKAGNNMNLQWNPVETDTEGNPQSVDWYNIYVGLTPDFAPDDEHFLDTSLVPNYTHFDVTDLDVPRVFYKVTAEYGVGIITRTKTTIPVLMKTPEKKGR